MAESSDVESLISEAGMMFSTYVSAVSLLEVGFGPTDKASFRQKSKASDFYFDKNIKKVTSDTVDQEDLIGSDKSGKKFLYIPIEHEWYSARYNLVAWMDKEKTGGKSARKQANDALIFTSAWNANSFLVTENVKDFTRFNKIMYEEHGGYLPIFTLDDLRKSKIDEVVFPDNLS